VRVLPVEVFSMIGKTVSHCRIIEKLGQGSMGAVYPAEDTNLRDYDAVRILPHEFPPPTLMAMNASSITCANSWGAAQPVSWAGRAPDASPLIHLTRCEMPTSHVRCQRALMLTSAVVITLWGSVGLYQGLNTGFSGGLYDPEYRISAVRRGSPADKSGFIPGDRVISVEGRTVEELVMESRWPRSLVPRIGESRRFVVDRNGERIPAGAAERQTLRR
jgi:hypothetical protein